MSLRVVAHAQWLTLARAVLTKADLLRPVSFTQRHNFTHTPSIAQNISKDEAGFFTPPKKSLSILERSLSEYKDIDEEFINVTPHNANECLQKVVQDRNWPAANRLRTRMLGSSITIQPSLVYEDAALHAARTATVETRVDDFAAWLALVPDAKDTFSSGFQRLLEELTTLPSLIGPSGLILTTKGYINFVRAHIVPLLATHVEPELRAHFLRAYEEESVIYVGKRTLHPAQETFSQKQTKTDHMFEEMDEYAAVDVDVDTTHATKHMEHLIADGQCHAALLLRQEFEEWDISIPPSSVYAFAAQQAITKLVDLVALKQDTCVDDDLVSSAFSSWFSLVPNASQTTGDLTWLHNLRHHLLTMPRTNIPVLLQFGFICAEKGYSQDVSSYIMPHIIRFSAPDFSYDFLQRFIDHATTWDAQHGIPKRNRDGAVCEYMRLALREYAQAGYVDHAMQVLQQCESDAIKLPRSTYDFLFRKLQLRPQRAAVMISKVLEAKKRWYPLGALEVLSFDDFPRPDHEVARLVEEGRFDQATQLLREWKGAPIPSDHWYSYPAELALQHSNPAERLTSFEAWFSLIPDAPTSISRSFSGIKSSLLPISTDTQSAIVFALLCARKGYFNAISKDIIPSIIKKAYPYSSARFLDELLIVAKESMVHRYPTWEVKLQITRLLDVCVRTYCDDRRPLEAVAFLRSQEQHSVRPSRKVLDMLIGILKDFYFKEGSNMNADILYVRKLRDFPITSTPVTSNLLTDLRYWRNVFSSRNKQLGIPHHETAAAFIEGYAKSGRQKALFILRDKALRSLSSPLGSAWVLGEMTFHHRQKNHSLVITTFASHFTLVGVPRLSILNFLQDWEKSSGDLGVASPRGRALPSPKHVSLVWHAMISLAQDRATLSLLYNQFRQEVRVSQNGNLKLRLSQKELIGDTKEAPRPPPTLLFERGIFTHFISAFTRQYSARYGARIVMDMIKMRIAPGVYQLSLVAEAYAKQGEAYPAISLLQVMEWSDALRREDIPPNAVKADQLEMLKASLLASQFSIPPPNLASYLAVIRAFLALDKIQAAYEVRRLMGRQLRYEIGSNTEMDQIIVELEAKLTAMRRMARQR